MSGSTLSEAVRPDPRLPRALLAAGVVLVGTTALLPYLPGGGRPAWLTGVFPLLIGVACLAPILAIACDRRLPASHRRPWKPVVGAIGVLLCAQAFWALAGAPTLSPIVLLHLLAYGLFVAGISGFPSALRDHEMRVAAWSDAMLIAVGAYTLIWALYLGPLAAGSSTLSPTEAMVAALWPAADLVILFAALTVLLRPQPVAIRVAALWVAAAAMLQFAGNLVYTAEAIADPHRRFGPPDLLWGSAHLALGYAAYQHRRLAGDPRIVQPRWLTERGYRAIPHLSLGLAAVLLFWTLAARWDGLAVGLALAAFLLIGVALFRERHTARHNAQLQLAAAQQRSEARFRALVENATDIIAVTDGTGTLAYVTPSIERVLGYPAGELVGERLSDYLHEDDRPAVVAVRRLPAGEAQVPPAGGVCRVRHRDGSWRHIEFSGANRSVHPEIGGFVVNARDVTERVRLERQLSFQAKHDTLTGLANRRLFSERLEQCGASGGDPKSAAVLYLDLDGFKRVNDTLGHDQGDVLLTLVAERLLSATRGSDTVARLGGDEFAVLLCGVRTRADIEVVAERICSSLVRPFDLGGGEATVGVSIGVAWHRAGEPDDQLLRKADIAMYRAKRDGGSRYAFHEPEPDDPAAERAVA